MIATTERAAAPGLVLDLGLISERELAASLRESVRTTRERRYTGTGPAYLVLGGRILYRRNVVLDWLAAHDVPSGSTA